ncbi:MAG: alpha-amylase family glycosyl hydrolase [Rufibacter sp.]
MSFILFLIAPVCAVLGQQAQVTFRVDMSQHAVSSNGVYVAGNFQSEAGYGADWNPGITRLTDADNDQVYEVTVYLPKGQYQFKFVNGGNWTQAEAVPVTCGVENGSGNYNRQVMVGPGHLRLPISRFSSCNTQVFLAGNMNGQPVSPNGVHVAGNFQALAGYGTDWNPASVPLTDPDGDGVYQVQLSLPAGGLFQYKFINGNSWAGAEIVPEACGVNDGAGNVNRTINATANSTTVPAYRFSTCETEGTTMPSTDYHTFWWNDAVFYEIFVRSFYDSNGDGKGDFKGLTQKLDYLNDGNPNSTSDLGITGIWLMPIMESPSYHGYDVTNYNAIETDYGSMADFEEFLAAAHARGIKVIIDLVLNHTSEQHPWFTQSSSSSSSSNAYRDWYVWSVTNPGFTGPWGQGVWHQRNGHYYYGIFYSGMPDLNWGNTSLKSTMWDITRFWLNKGVDGFRLDAVKYLDENGSTVEDTPETYGILEEFNQVTKEAKASAFNVGEAWSNTSAVVPYVVNNRLDAAFEFDLASAILSSVNSNNPATVKNQLNLVNRLYPKLQYATFLTNHDQNRAIGALGGNIPHMKQAAALYLTMPGVPFLYYGEEIGMLGSGVDEDKRKPMQWNAGYNAGFTTSTPWRSLNANANQFNVDLMQSDPVSLLSHYKKLIRIRQEQPTLRKGYYQEMTSGNASVLAYGRVYEQQAALIISNFGNDAITNPIVSLPVSTLAAGTYQVQELYSGQSMGTVSVTAEGAISNWAITGSLGADLTWLLLLSPTRVTGTSKAYEVVSVQLFPNPSHDQVTLKVGEEASGKKSIRVFDATGKIMHQVSFYGATISLQTKNWSNGFYFLQIQSGEKIYMMRLVVQH